MKSKTMILAASIAASLAVNAAEAWISADKDGETRCSWTNAVTFAEGKATITDNALQPTQEAADSSLKKVTMTIKTTFSVCGDTEEKPDDDAQAAVRLTADGFQVWTLNVDNAKTWLSVSNADLAITESEDEYGAEYEITFVFDYGADPQPQYSVKVNGKQLTDNGDSDFPVAFQRAEKLSEVGFVGTTQFTSLASWLGEMTQEGFASGDSVSVSGGTVTLNAKQAEWLDSLGEKTNVEGAVATLTADQFKKAWLLNLDITDADWENFSFSVSGFTVYSDHVDVGVTLTRNNRNNNAAIYGTLKFYAEPTLSALNITTEPARTENLTNANFGEGNEATVSLPLGDGENKPSFFKAGIDEPDEPTE